MSFLEKLVFSTSQLLSPQNSVVRRLSKEEYINTVAQNPLHRLYLKHWKFAQGPSRIRMLLLASLTLIAVYIVSPTISYYHQSEESRNKMFSSKRQDKHTTGLINTRNDCFANSSVQAFASLPGLDSYLNDILKQYQLLLSLPLTTTDPFPQLPLHEALAQIIQQLEEPIASPKHISVWPFLQVIEKIFNSRISTNQNDAHELVQLILETLDNECTKLKKFTKRHNLNFVIPELPFNGLLADQLTCYACLNSSKPTFHPFAVLSLPVPQQNNATLDDMLKSNEVETINGYHCLRCKIKAILKVEEEKATKGISLNEEDAQKISKLKIMETNLTINDDLSEDLEKFVKSYEYEGFKTENLQSTIVKKTLVVKAPNLLTIHLSRSMFTANHITRNGCRVAFEDVLNIDVDENLAQEYEQRQKAAKKAKKKRESSIMTPSGEMVDDHADNGDDDADDDEDDIDDDIEGYDPDRNEPIHLARIHSKVLTSHDEKTEHDNVEHVEESASVQDNSAESDDLHESTEATSYDEDEVLRNDEVQIDDEGSIESSEEELNVVTMSNARYRLRAVIRHQGTHNAGHYECYRHKPLLVKDTQLDRIVNLSAVIEVGKQNEETEEEEIVNEQSNHRYLSPNGESPKMKSSRKFSRGSTGPSSPVGPESISRTSDTFEHGEAITSEDEGSHFSKFRSRIGSLVSRRPSVSGGASNGTSSRRNSISAAHQHYPSTPVIDELSTNIENINVNADAKAGEKKRYKKISSVAKYPFWRISDTMISEVKKSDVLKEKTAVYMIYYEKIQK